MRLLFISQLFDPEYSIKGLAFLKELQAKGIEIDVITTFPNYPTGKVFDGYKIKPWQVEYQDGIRILRVYSFISHSKSKFSRALSYVSFMIMAFWATFFIKRPSAIYAYHPQLTIGLIAILLKWFRRIPYVTDVQDLWPDALVATGMQRGRYVYDWLGRLCLLVYKQAAHIVVLSKGYKQALIERGVDAHKITVVYNWHADEAIFEKSSSKELLRTQYQYRFVYAGNLGAAQSLKAVIDAFASLKNASISLSIIGAGVEELELQSHSKKIAAENIFFLGYVSSTQIKAYLAQADVLVVHLKDEDLFKITIPSKVQAYLSSGKPILMAVGGEANEIVEEAKAGCVAMPNNSKSIAEAAQKLVDTKDRWREMGLNARRFYEDKMSQKKAVVQIADILNHVSR